MNIEDRVISMLSLDRVADEDLREYDKLTRHFYAFGRSLPWLDAEGDAEGAEVAMGEIRRCYARMLELQGEPMRPTEAILLDVCLAGVGV